MRAFVLGLLALSLSSCFGPGFNTSAGEEEWWDSDWKYRIKLEFDPLVSVQSSVSSFVVLVRLEDVPFSGHNQTDYRDIRFVSRSEDGSQTLPHELESGQDDLSDSDNNTVAWVKIPTVNTTDTGTKNYFWVYFGNQDASDSSSSSSTWSKYEMVYHFSSSSPYQDVTGNNHNGTVVGTPYDDAGKIGRARRFSDADTDYVDLPDQTNSILNGQTYATVYAWVKVSASGALNNNPILNIEAETAWPAIRRYSVQVGSFGSLGGFVSALDGNGESSPTTNSTVALSNWVQVVSTISLASGNWSGYVNGTQVFSFSPSISSSTFTTVDSEDVRMARGEGGNYFRGHLDEVRFARRYMSESEVNLSYYSETGQLLLYGEVEEYDKSFFPIFGD